MNPDPAAALLRAGSEALLRVAGQSLALGVVAGLAVAALIFVGSKFIPPRAPRGEVWAQWRRRLWLWLSAPPLGAAGALLAADSLAQAAGRSSLAWMDRLPDLRLIAWLGSGSGFLLCLFFLVLAARLTRRR